MPIELRCSCGKRVSVADEQAGRKVRCPGCQGILRVPGDATADEGYTTEASRQCPSCRQEWPEDAVVCVNCGYNFETGKKLKTVYELLERTVDVGVTWLGCYTRFVIFRDRKGNATLTIAKKFLFLPAGTRVIDLRGYDTVLTDVTLGRTGGEDTASDVYYLELEGPRRRPLRIMTTSNEWKMREVIDTLQDAARLQVKRK